MSEAGARVREIYHQMHARRATSATLAAIAAEVGAAIGLLSPDGSVRPTELDRLAPELRLGPASRLLDVGCGSGAPARYLARAAGCGVVGIDLVLARVARARDAATEAGLAERAAFLVANANLGLPLRDRSVDGATVIDTLIHVPDKPALLAEIARALRPGGRLAIVSSTGALTAEQMAAVGQAEIWFGGPPEEIARATADTGYRLRLVEDRGEWITHLHATRLEAMLRREVDLVQEVGADQAQVLVGRQRAFADFSRRGLIGSVLVVAESA
ncbi:MAG: methyltransferase domain-containing protein [Chloroflexi bacterium]|nr:methyltransferase domain-containing protein [Chloroflexota bacterium]